MPIYNLSNLLLHLNFIFLLASIKSKYSKNTLYSHAFLISKSNLTCFISFSNRVSILKKTAVTLKFDLGRESKISISYIVCWWSMSRIKYTISQNTQQFRVLNFFSSKLINVLDFIDDFFLSFQTTLPSFKLKG